MSFDDRGFEVPAAIPKPYRLLNSHELGGGGGGDGGGGNGGGGGEGGGGEGAGGGGGEGGAGGGGALTVGQGLTLVHISLNLSRVDHTSPCPPV